MKLYKILLFILLITWAISNAQTFENRLSFGINLGSNEYNGDYGSAIWNFSKTGYYSGGLSLTGDISSSFDLGIQGTYGYYGFKEDATNQFVGTKFDASLFTHYKLNNGYILQEQNKFSPFISIGFGIATYGTSNSAAPWPTIITNGVDLIVPIGFGLKYQLSDNLSLQYQYLYNFTSSDVHDQNRSGGVVNTIFGTPLHPGIKAGNDAFGEHLIGIVYKLDKEKDSDKDGIADKFDLCPDTPADVPVNSHGCAIDSDNDGVPDYKDGCPFTPSGVKVDIYGCPVDSDEDGVPDYLDKCPTTKGLPKFGGCPYSKGTGILDKSDK